MPSSFIKSAVNHYQIVLMVCTGAVREVLHVQVLVFFVHSPYGPGAGRVLLHVCMRCC